MTLHSIQLVFLILTVVVLIGQLAVFVTNRQLSLNQFLIALGIHSITLFLSLCLIATS